MSPAISGPGAAPRLSQVPSETVQNAQQTVRDAASRQPAESGPANIRSETLRAIDPVRQSDPPKRTRASGSNDAERVESQPAGPPPAFAETLLERQARQIFDAPDEIKTASQDALERSSAKEAYDTARVTFEERPGLAPLLPIKGIPE